MTYTAPRDLSGSYASVRRARHAAVRARELADQKDGGALMTRPTRPPRVPAIAHRSRARDGRRGVGGVAAGDAAGRSRQRGVPGLRACAGGGRARCASSTRVSTPTPTPPPGLSRRRRWTAAPATTWTRSCTARSTPPLPAARATASLAPGRSCEIVSVRATDTPEPRATRRPTSSTTTCGHSTCSAPRTELASPSSSFR